ncbi:MAG: tetratricopeptide repeat protein, partial [Lentisphaerae bacterium]|nr:tetratricopeptide repeat protein [Lentisphaerota bacterium]
VGDGEAAEGVRVADVEKTLEVHAPRGVPGRELLYDHVHLKFSGNYLAAGTIFEQVSRAVPQWMRDGSSGRPMPSEEDCARTLVLTCLDRYKIAGEILRRYSRPPLSDRLNHGEEVSSLLAEMKPFGDCRQGPALQQVLAEYKEALTGDDADWSVRYRYAVLLVEYTRDLPEAEKQLRATVEQRPQFAEACARLGKVLSLQGKYDEALLFCLRALKYNPVSPLLENSIGSLFLLQGEHGDAIPHFQRAVVLNPRLADAHFNLASCLVQLKPGDPRNRERAVMHYRKVLEINPEDREAQRLLEGLTRSE